MCSLSLFSSEKESLPHPSVIVPKWEKSALERSEERQSWSFCANKWLCYSGQVRATILEAVSFLVTNFDGRVLCPLFTSLLSVLWDYACSLDNQYIWFWLQDHEFRGDSGLRWVVCSPSDPIQIDLWSQCPVYGLCIAPHLHVAFLRFRNFTWRSVTTDWKARLWQCMSDVLSSSFRS